MDLASAIYTAVFLMAAFSSSEAMDSSCSLQNKTVTCQNLKELPSINENAVTLKITNPLFNSTTLENIDLPGHIRKLIIRKGTFKTIGPFKPNKNLTELLISSSGLEDIQLGAFDNFKNLERLSLDDNNISSFPKIHIRSLQILDLRSNSIREFKLEHLSKLPNLKELFLNHNHFTSLKNDLFPEQNKIELLIMSNNRITKIESRAFEKLSSLRKLVLENTDIENLPTKGLSQLITLNLKGVTRLRTIPGGLDNIENVQLADKKSFLCCKLFFDRRLGLTGPVTKSPPLTSATQISTTPGTPTKNQITNSSRHTLLSGFGRHRRDVVITLHPSAMATGTFNPPATPGPLNCTPNPTAFQPCENIMGAAWLTVASFIVGPFAVCGNFVVLLVFLCLARSYNVSRFLVTNLAIADLTMGVYLLSLVIESVITSGEYYAHVERFQLGMSCKVLGFLAMFSSELSVFSLTMITVERYLTIVYAMYPRYRLRMRPALIAMVIGWTVAITIAILPNLGVGSYSKVAICLPFDTEHGGDLYLFVVFGLNGVGFIFICVLYAQMYRSVFNPSNSTPTRGHDSRVARRMAILVFTDFACFTPIAVNVVSALLGNPLISVAQSKYLLVFFFPLNGLLNPFLYAIITKAFRRDLAGLLKNCFVCGETLTNYISTFPARSVQSTNDALNASARPSLDFNAIDGFHSLGNIRGSRENPVSASFSKSEPNLVKFNNHEL